MISRDNHYMEKLFKKVAMTFFNLSW